jgi:hypothetical protein
VAGGLGQNQRYRGKIEALQLFIAAITTPPAFMVK